MTDLLSDDFRAFSAALGKDPLRVQGPGGNTSIKAGDVMWIKASGTELADAVEKPIFVAVDRNAAKAQAGGAGDGSCKDTVLDPDNTLRPSIETTFHAALDWAVVAHTHSIETLTHAVSPEGRIASDAKLKGLPFIRVPYAKPGLPLTQQIMARVTAETQIIILENHGLICCADSVAATAQIMDEVEARLAMPVNDTDFQTPSEPPLNGFTWVAESWLAQNTATADLIVAGSYYPDHVVFLGPALPQGDHDGTPPAIVQKGIGILIRDGATSSQKSMLRCLSDLFSRLPAGWTPSAIGTEAEVELLNWDAEKYRQALAART
ncbi:MAG: rhamnose utilization protein RhaD (predicted bifunctional aldolase and dehydrogenase) [Ascidiaceihabitans sp.]|jgi:rhamnose utilization protein RhaD (predicted bifunctional aldolase and dehydrogenase)